MVSSCLQNKVQAPWQGQLPVQPPSSCLAQLSTPGSSPVWTMSTSAALCAFWVGWQKTGRWEDREVTVCFPLVFFPPTYGRTPPPTVLTDWVLVYSCSSHWVLVTFPFCEQSLPHILFTFLWSLLVSCRDRLIQTCILFSSLLSHWPLSRRVLAAHFPNTMQFTAPSFPSPWKSFCLSLWDKLLLNI